MPQVGGDEPAPPSLTATVSTIRQDTFAMKRPLAVVAVFTAATFTLSACGSSGSDSSSHAGRGSSSSAGSTSSSHNQQDVTFASDMVTHHQAAITMAQLAPSRASSAHVKKLAADIEAAQGPEITKMTGWLKAWGAKMPSDTKSGMDHGDMGSMGGSMPGMMSPAAMKKLAAATGATFDRMWLRGMVTHHRGAITMSDTEIAKGKNADAIKLAHTIKAAQSGEVVTMTSLLGS
jgi:uncharacterized protein (DUF305 family)